MPVQHDDVLLTQPTARRNKPGRFAGQWPARQHGRVIAAKQVNVPCQGDAEAWIMDGRGPGAAQERDIEVHYAAAIKLLVKRRLILDGVSR